jgi:hypothetical protein
VMTGAETEGIVEVGANVGVAATDPVGTFQPGRAFSWSVAGGFTSAVFSDEFGEGRVLG